MLHREGISCDSCKRDNIKGKGYKCMVCYEYYSCSHCYESAASSSQHNSDHSMQCIFARRECELLFGSSGEANNFKNEYNGDNRNRTPRNKSKQSNPRQMVNGHLIGDDIFVHKTSSRSPKSSAPQAVPKPQNGRRTEKVQSLPYYAGAKFSDPPPPNSLPMPPQHWITRNGDR